MVSVVEGMRTPELMERLRRHYIAPGPMPGGVFVDECQLGRAGASRADGLYVGFTSTSGRILIGHEVKTSRSDWRKELDTVGKADPWADECHSFYVVAPSVEIVHPEELPDGWGLLVVNPRSKVRLDVKAKARSKGPDHTPSWEAVRSIFARLDTLMWADIGRREREVDQKIRQKITTEIETRERRSADSRTHALEGLVRRLEEALGCQIDDYTRRLRANDPTLDVISPDELQSAVRMIRAERPLFGRYANARPDHLADQLERAAEALRALSVADTEVYEGRDLL